MKNRNIAKHLRNIYTLLQEVSDLAPNTKWADAARFRAKISSYKIELDNDLLEEVKEVCD